MTFRNLILTSPLLLWGFAALPANAALQTGEPVNVIHAVPATTLASGGKIALTLLLADIEPVAAMCKT